MIRELHSPSLSKLLNEALDSISETKNHIETCDSCTEAEVCSAGEQLYLACRAKTKETYFLDARACSACGQYEHQDGYCPARDEPDYF